MKMLQHVCARMCMCVGVGVGVYVCECVRVCTVM
jgi:hypothetical protein